MKHLLLVFFILTLFFLTNVYTTVDAAITVNTLPFTNCDGTTVYTLPFSTPFATYYTLPATVYCCGGYIASDCCSGCAGQGNGNACWREAALVTTCTNACASYGGCVAANWNDNTSCSVCKYYHPGISCATSSSGAGPMWGGENVCHYRVSSVNQSCGANTGGDRRMCVCAF